MKVALCFIISYEHILNKEQLWINWIESNKDIINVYFHYKDIRKIKSPWIKMHTIPPNVTQQTTYYNVVPAYTSLLTYAYTHDTNNEWFCLLTDACVPIIHPNKFRKLFFKNFNRSIIRCMPAYWNIELHQRANLKYLSSEYWLANDPWFTLTRSHVQKFLLFLTMKNTIYNRINAGGLANESMFAIVLKTFNEISNDKTHINESSTVSDWSRMSSPTSPYLFIDANEENKNMIQSLIKKNKYAMFLRKVHKKFPDECILEIIGSDPELYIQYSFVRYACVILFLFTFVFAKPLMDAYYFKKDV
jgi:hypothetical protein